MAAKVKPVPEGYHSVTPYLSVKDAAQALEFYKRAFGAEEVLRMNMPDGRIGHAEIQIGDSRVMLAEEMPEVPDFVVRSPKSLGGSTVGLCVYILDVDARVQRAVEAGAKIKRPLRDQFYGDRSSVLEDPFGHFWTLSTHVEDVSSDEMRKRMASLPRG